MSEIISYFKVCDIVKHISQQPYWVDEGIIIDYKDKTYIQRKTTTPTILSKEAKRVHLHIIDDEILKINEIIDGTLVLDIGSSFTRPFVWGNNFDTNTYEYYCINDSEHQLKKVIASTDKLLKCPLINQELIEEYCNKQGFKKVLVEYGESFDEINNKWTDLAPILLNNTINAQVLSDRLIRFQNKYVKLIKPSKIYTEEQLNEIANDVYIFGFKKANDIENKLDSFENWFKNRKKEL